MDQFDAAEKADEMMTLILTHQAGLFSKNGIYNEGDGKQFAKTIAAIRQTLIEELTNQA